MKRAFFVFALGLCEAACAHRAEHEWWRDSVGYEIFVRSFQDSDGDGVGDLAGITRRLDDLGRLGVDLLWLTPIHPGPTYHGYAVADYRAVSPEYGTLEDFDRLIAAAHAHGMHVILDLVLNHTASTHPWFMDAIHPASPRREWYVWSDRDPGWRQIWSDRKTWFAKNGAFYYGLFGDDMPDLNYTNRDVQNEMLDVAAFWLMHGADGFRLDAIRYLVETGGGAEGQADTRPTHDFLRRLRAEVDRHKADALLVGEIWDKTETIAPYFGTRSAPELEMAFDFESASAIVESIAKQDASALARALERRLEALPDLGTPGTFLTNHDQVRVASRLPDPRAQRLAAAILLTLPGTPWLYYGEEIGMTDGYELAGDLSKRRPMQWSADPARGFTTHEAAWIAATSTRAADTVEAQSSDEQSLYAVYRALIARRRASAVLRRGRTRIVEAKGPRLVIERSFEGRTRTIAYDLEARTWEEN